METFSVSVLARSLFAPFKQTFAGNVKGSLGDHFRSFVDKTISRFIGFFVRSFLLFTAFLCMLFVLLSGLLLLLLWPLIPLLPLIAVGLMGMGVGV